MVKVSTVHYKIHHSDCDAEYVVSQPVFEDLITVYFSSPTSCTQKVYLSDTKIVSLGGDQVLFGNSSQPKIDSRFIPFKTIELDNCEFVTKCKATSTTISKWLQQPLTQLRDDIGSCFFRLSNVEDADCCPSRKRKFSEIDSDNT